MKKGLSFILIWLILIWIILFIYVNSWMMNDNINYLNQFSHKLSDKILWIENKNIDLEKTNIDSQSEYNAQDENNSSNFDLAQQNKIEIENNLFENEKKYNFQKSPEYKFNWKMDKPDIVKMTNLKYITWWFYEKWEMDYKFDKQPDLYLKEDWTKCDKIEFKNYDKWNIIKSLTQDEIKNLNYTIKLVDTYSWNWYFNWSWAYYSNFWNWNLIWEYSKLQLNTGQLNFLNKNWFVVLDPKWYFTSYSWEWNEPILDPMWFREEWQETLMSIWWQTDEFRRYPYHSVFISSDLMLHNFHILFANNLKYYEQTVARKTMWEISKTMFEKFIQLEKTQPNEKLKKYYQFLISYWAIASTLFTDEKVLLERDWNIYSLSQDLDDDLLKEKLFKILWTKIVYLPNNLKTSTLEELNKIFQADDWQSIDVLINEYFPDFEKNKIYQNYPLFKPRSHYSENSILKTYFMWMKFLMQQKFYFVDDDLAKVWLINVNNIDKQTNDKFNKMFEFFTKLIWKDDDVNILDIQNFLNIKWLKSDLEIIEKYDENIKIDLINLKQQNIIWTSYSTNSIWEISEKQAHEMTKWFVFFWEKTTLDSYFYDFLSAGSAEQEYIEKPSVVTALSIPQILINQKFIDEIVNYWLENWLKQNLITQQQLDWFKKYTQQLKEKVEYFDFSKNIYHKWLEVLAYIFVQDENSPYFVKNPLYQLKNLITFLWSYTELKHDTILYTKQTFAEFWWWGWESCVVDIQPPSLPVPKWYIEPNIDLIDKLIQISTDTNLFFNDENFWKYIEFLNFSKKIAISQSKNEKISDIDFEKLRLYYIEMINITTPNKYIWAVLEKEERSWIVSDIFTSSENWALYVANWRPMLILLMIEDINWPRVVLWPVFTNYEFFWDPINRMTDTMWQNWYEEIFSTQSEKKSIPYQMLQNEIEK